MATESLFEALAQPTFRTPVEQNAEYVRLLA